MKKPFLVLALGCVGIFSSSLFSAPRAADPLAEITQQIAHEILSNGQAYSNLASFTSIGPRLCGSAQAARAVDWAKAKLESYGLDKVWLQPVQVPVWIRGNHESAALLSGAGETPLRVTALGNSAGTPEGGVTAEVVEVKSLDEVRRLGARLRGKIVFYNRPMDPSLADAFEAYGRAVDQRTAGPALAAKYGAVGALVRTMTTLADDTHPHTGVTSFGGSAAAIPAAAVATRDANLLSARIAQDGSARVRLELSARRLAPTTSYNVIGELAGSEIPSEIVAVGGHLDSWDLSPGAHDDGAGVTQSIEALRVLKALDLKPKRSVRAVLFMCEEFGGIGADEYARQAKERGENHIVATESDRGGFRPLGFAAEDPSDRALSRLRQWSKYLAPLQADAVEEGASGTDVEPLAELGTATFGLLDESKHYFDVHHSELDQLSAVDPRELSEGAAAMAILTYLAAEQGI